MIPPGPGGWGDKYPSKWYQVTFAMAMLRDWKQGIMPLSPDPDTALLIDPDADIHLEPRYYSTIYQARIGISPNWQLYIKWPTNEYRWVLEEPNYAPVPTERTDRGYIGFCDSTESPIHNVIDPNQAMRFEMFFVRDWMPVYMSYVNSICDYAKIIMRFLLNKLTIKAVTDETIRAKLERKEIPYKPVFHYSVYVARSEGLVI